MVAVQEIEMVDHSEDMVVEGILLRDMVWPAGSGRNPENRSQTNLCNLNLFSFLFLALMFKIHRKFNVRNLKSGTC